MNKDQKTATIAELKDKFSSSPFFYITDASTLPVEQTNKLRRMCFQKGIEMKVLKNTLIKKALEASPSGKGYENVYQLLHGPTTVLFSDTAKGPAEIIALLCLLSVSRGLRMEGVAASIVRIRVVRNCHAWGAGIQGHPRNGWCNSVGPGVSGRGLVALRVAEVER